MRLPRVAEAIPLNHCSQYSLYQSPHRDRCNIAVLPAWVLFLPSGKPKTSQIFSRENSSISWSRFALESGPEEPA
jgi:hypothetical protein